MDAPARDADGSKPPLLMIHGAFCGGWAFDKLAGFFSARGYDCHTPSLRYHDREPHLPPHRQLATTSMADYAHDLVALIDTLGAAPIVVGHSLGGLLAQMVAARRPVAALVLLAPSAPWGVLPDGPLELLGAGSLYLSGAFWQEALLPHRGTAAEYTFDRMPHDERQALVRRLVPESGRATFEILHWAHDPRRTTFVFPRDVTCPVLGMAGTHDRINPIGLVRRITRRYRTRSAFIELPGMSHWLLTEPGWDEMAETIAGWLETTLTAREPV